MPKTIPTGREAVHASTRTESALSGERVPVPAPKGGQLVADLSEFFTRRKHQRGSLVLPLVRPSRCEE